MLFRSMCHEATSVGLPQSLGSGKGTVTLDDFDHCDAIFCIGHNPGTNHPRMLSTLREASLRGVPIVVLNPLPERGLERFTSPQHPMEMLTNSSVRIASTYYKLKIGGDVAVLKGMMKYLLVEDAKALAEGMPGVIDRDFIAANTHGFEALVADVEATDWHAIERKSGLTRAEIEYAAGIYAKATKVIVCYGMGITQHAHGTENVQQIANLLLMRGNIGREGAGICPLRGHSNVQGDRTVGITEKPNAALNEGIRKTYGFEPPVDHGHDAVAAVIAIREGRSKALVALGGNLAVAMPDTEETFAAMRGLDLAVHIATKLNRSHLILAKESFILPCLGRTELDEQATGPQAVTVEDSMSMVHASAGTLKPASVHLHSEPWIVGGIAKATLPGTKVNWDALVADYNLIRDDIEKVFPIFHDFNRRVNVPGGFRLRVAASERAWDTPDRRAQFLLARGLDEDAPLGEGDLMLTTIRSHDQYNTTIYGLNDRYRGVTGRRDVIFMHEKDLAARGLKQGDRIDVFATGINVADGKERAVRGFTAVAFEIAEGSVAMYYPEGNALIALESHDRRSGTPAYKSVPVRIVASTAPADAHGMRKRPTHAGA